MLSLHRLPILLLAGFGWLLLIATPCLAWNKRLRLLLDVVCEFL